MLEENAASRHGETGAMRTVLLFSLCSLAACSASFGERVHEEVRRTVATGAAPMVRVENVAGEIAVEGWAKPAVDVDATKYGYDQQDLQKVAVDVRAEEGGVSIVTRYTGETHHGGVRYRISVPADASLQIVNVAGTVELAGVGGNVSVQTQVGEITANAGRVAGNRSIDLNATTGAIALTISSDSSATIDATSSVGSFASDFPSVSQERRNLVGARGTGTIGSGSARITLRTTTGAIALKR
jgi:hypothetical protein